MLTALLFTHTWVNCQSFKVFKSSNSGLPVDMIHAFDIDTNSNTLWIGTSHYLVTLQHDSIWDTINTVFPNNAWYAVKVDSKGNTWVGGDTDCKLYRFSNGTMTEFTDSLNSIGEVRAIEEDAYGNIWVGLTSANGLRMFDGQRWFDYSDSVLNEGIWAMELGFDSLMWFGSWAEELFRYDGRRFKQYSYLNSAIPNSRITEISKGIYPNIWIGTRAGILSFDGDTTWKHYTESNSQLADDQVYAIAIDEDSIAWLGYNATPFLGKKDSNVFSRINYPFNTISETFEIRITSDGKKWIAGQGGLLCYNDGGAGPAKAPTQKPSSSKMLIHKENLIELFPNPTNGIVHMKGLLQKSIVSIYNSNFVRIKTFNNPLKDALILPDAKGLYIIGVEQNGIQSFHKLLKL